MFLGQLSSGGDSGAQHRGSAAPAREASALVPSSVGSASPSPPASLTGLLSAGVSRDPLRRFQSLHFPQMFAEHLLALLQRQDTKQADPRCHGAFTPAPGLSDSRRMGITQEACLNADGWAPAPELQVQLVPGVGPEGLLV